MKSLAFGLYIATVSAVSVSAADGRFDRSLSRLDPQTRLEQVCDIEAMNRISRDPNPFRPDRAKAEGLFPPRHLGHKLIGKGGAFRSKGVWYAFSFECEATPDHMKVLSFTYRIGEPIPETKWETHGLW